jgi:hypothetical protein
MSPPTYHGDGRDTGQRPRPPWNAGAGAQRQDAPGAHPSINYQRQDSRGGLAQGGRAIRGQGQAGRGGRGARAGLGGIMNSINQIAEQNRAQDERRRNVNTSRESQRGRVQDNRNQQQQRRCDIQSHREDQHARSAHVPVNTGTVNHPMPTNKGMNKRTLDDRIQNDTMPTNKSMNKRTADDSSQNNTQATEWSRKKVKTFHSASLPVEPLQKRAIPLPSQTSSQVSVSKVVMDKTVSAEKIASANKRTRDTYEQNNPKGEISHKNPKIDDSASSTVAMPKKKVDATCSQTPSHLPARPPTPTDRKILTPASKCSTKNDGPHPAHAMPPSPTTPQSPKSFKASSQLPNKKLDAQMSVAPQPATSSKTPSQASTKKDEVSPPVAPAPSTTTSVSAPKTDTETPDSALPKKTNLPPTPSPSPPKAQGQNSVEAPAPKPTPKTFVLGRLFPWPKEMLPYDKMKSAPILYSDKAVHRPFQFDKRNLAFWKNTAVYALAAIQGGITPPENGNKDETRMNWGYTNQGRTGPEHVIDDVDINLYNNTAYVALKAGLAPVARYLEWQKVPADSKIRFNGRTPTWAKELFETSKTLETWRSWTPEPWMSTQDKRVEKTCRNWQKLNARYHFLRRKRVLDKFEQAEYDGDLALAVQMWSTEYDRTLAEPDPEGAISVPEYDATKMEKSLPLHTLAQVVVYDTSMDSKGVVWALGKHQEPRHNGFEEPTIFGIFPMAITRAVTPPQKQSTGVEPWRLKYFDDCAKFRAMGLEKKAARALEAAAPASPPVVSPPAVSSPAVSSPATPSPVSEPPVVEPPVVESPAAESPAVESLAVEPAVAPPPVAIVVEEKPALAVEVAPTDDEPKFDPTDPFEVDYSDGEL